MNQQQAIDGQRVLVELSVVICVEERVSGPSALLEAYRAALAPLGRRIEYIFVVSQASGQLSAVRELAADDVTIVQLPKQFGDASRLREGVSAARAGDVLILPSYIQVVSTALPGLVERLAHADVVIASRVRNRDAFLNRARGIAFRSVARLAGSRFEDLGCRVRALRREVLDQIVLQEDQTSFLPIFAEHAGFLVEQVPVPQAPVDQAYRSHSMRAYAQNILDAVSIGFLMRFLQKPFRLFGAIGAFLAFMGVLQGLVLLIQRANGVSLSDRPALLMAVLLVVLGLQIGSVGLIAEVVLFTRLPATSTYRIRRIFERSADEDDLASAEPNDEA